MHIRAHARKHYRRSREINSSHTRRDSESLVQHFRQRRASRQRRTAPFLPQPTVYNAFRHDRSRNRPGVTDIDPRYRLIFLQLSRDFYRHYCVVLSCTICPFYRLHKLNCSRNPSMNGTGQTYRASDLSKNGLLHNISYAV